MNTDTIDELAAFGQSAHDDIDQQGVSSTVTDFAVRNPVSAMLTAAAAGAALIALATLMGRRAHDPLAPVSLVSSRGFDFESLRQQVADLADRFGKATPVGAAKQRVGQAGDAISEGWSALREQALDAIGRFEPQAGAVVKVARDNPLWTALAVGAVGALVGWQLLGKGTDAVGFGTSNYPDARV